MLFYNSRVDSCQEGGVSQARAECERAERERARGVRNRPLERAARDEAREDGAGDEIYAALAAVLGRCSAAAGRTEAATPKRSSRRAVSR